MESPFPSPHEMEKMFEEVLGDIFEKHTGDRPKVEVRNFSMAGGRRHGKTAVNDIVNEALRKMAGVDEPKKENKVDFTSDAIWKKRRHELICAMLSGDIVEPPNGRNDMKAICSYAKEIVTRAEVIMGECATLDEMKERN